MDELARFLSKPPRKLGPNEQWRTLAPGDALVFHGTGFPAGRDATPAERKYYEETPMIWVTIARSEPQ